MSNTPRPHFNNATLPHRNHERGDPCSPCFGPSSRTKVNDLVKTRSPRALEERMSSPCVLKAVSSAVEWTAVALLLSPPSGSASSLAAIQTRSRPERSMFNQSLLKGRDQNSTAFRDSRALGCPNSEDVINSGHSPSRVALNEVNDDASSIELI